MRSESLSLLCRALLTGAFFLLPLSAYANTAELVDVSPEAEDITSLTENDGEGPPEGVAFVLLSGEIGTEYTAQFLVDAEPAVVITTGASLTSWSYDVETNLVTVVLDLTGFVEGIQDFGPYNPFGIAIVWPTQSQEEDGPPEQMIGAWMATNLMDWELIPPQPEQPFFGYRLGGPAGAEGFFRMFIPQATLELLSEFASEELSYSDLAVFVDDNQANMDIVEVEGGAEVRINVIFEEDTTQITSAVSGTITKEIVVKERLPLSLTAVKSSVEKMERVKLYGWLKSEKRGAKIILWRKKEGQKQFFYLKVARTNQEGKFTFFVRPTKTTQYQVTYKKLRSTKEEVEVSS